MHVNGDERNEMEEKILGDVPMERRSGILRSINYLQSLQSNQIRNTAKKKKKKMDVLRHRTILCSALRDFSFDWEIVERVYRCKGSAGKTRCLIIGYYTVLMCYSGGRFL